MIHVIFLFFMSQSAFPFSVVAPYIYVFEGAYVLVWLLPLVYEVAAPIQWEATLLKDVMSVMSEKEKCSCDC